MNTRLRTAVETACDRMGVVLTVSIEWPPMGEVSAAPRWLFAPAGPAALYVDGDDRRLWLEDKEAAHDEGWIWVLHELEHIVFWHPLRGVGCDEMLMMPWAVAVLRAEGLPSTVYMRSDYTLNTQIDIVGPLNQCSSEVWHWKRPERSAWFLRAKAANIAAGTITDDGLPTWRYPNWTYLEDWT